MTGFAELGIAAERIEALKTGGIDQPTPIQEAAIPAILRGQDVVCQAQTGTGKTLAFLLPMLEKINTDKDSLQGLILTPTRELALQITAELRRWTASRSDFSVLAVYGGQDVEAQLKKLKQSVHLVVATPGRLLDHLRRGTISLAAVTMLVLDEADQMLHMGFLSEVEEILSQIPQRRQTMLFSATMPAAVRSLAARFMRNPQDITVRAPQVTVKGIRQLVVETTDRAKQPTLRRLIDEHQPYLAVIFCRTKRRAGTLNEALQHFGYACDELHGDLSQAKREQVMKRFREAKLQLLVATDIAARGLDVEGITHVFNYDIPHDAESYIHRIGRTARAGGKGTAITLVAPKDRNELALIERGIHQSIAREQAERPADGKMERKKMANTEKSPAVSRGRGPASESRKSARSGGSTRRRSTGRDTAQQGRAAADPASKRQDRKRGQTAAKQGRRGRRSVR